jgi:hypothetical protein
MTDRLLSDSPFGAGLLFVGAVQVAALATALAPLLPQQRVGERRTTVRAWLIAVIGAIAAEPLAVANEPGALDLAALWRRACTEQTDGDQVPLVSWASLVAIAERLTPVFDAAGLGVLEQSWRVDCAETWVIAVPEQMIRDERQQWLSGREGFQATFCSHHDLKLVNRSHNCSKITDKTA